MSVVCVCERVGGAGAERRLFLFFGFFGFFVFGKVPILLLAGVERVVCSGKERSGGLWGCGAAGLRWGRGGGYTVCLDD